MADHPYHGPYPAEWNVDKVTLTNAEPFKVAVVAEGTCYVHGDAEQLVRHLPALLQEAPAMEALLRRLSENFYGDHDEAAKDIEEVDALLARIDAAKAAP